MTRSEIAITVALSATGAFLVITAGLYIHACLQVRKLKRLAAQPVTMTAYPDTWLTLPKHLEIVERKRA